MKTEYKQVLCSAEEDMFCHHTSACLSVCLQTSIKIYGKILMNFSGNVNIDTRNVLLHSGGDLVHCLDPGIWDFFYL